MTQKNHKINFFMHGILGLRCNTSTKSVVKATKIKTKTEVALVEMKDKIYL